MQAARIVDELSARMNELLAASPGRDLQKNARAFFAASLSRLDLVTREEFEVQTKVLARTREKLEALEARVAKLEESLKTEN
jgi:hypothetical protein